MKQELVVSNKKAVVTLSSEVFQLVVKILAGKRYQNLVDEIVENTEVVEL